MFLRRQFIAPRAHQACIRRETWGMGPYAGADYNLTESPFLITRCAGSRSPSNTGYENWIDKLGDVNPRPNKVESARRPAFTPTTMNAEECFPNHSKIEQPI